MRTRGDSSKKKTEEKKEKKEREKEKSNEKKENRGREGEEKGGRGKKMEGILGEQKMELVPAKIGSFFFVIQFPFLL